MIYELAVLNSEAEWGTVEADNIDKAIEKARAILANPNAWADGTEPFTADAQLIGPDAISVFSAECCVEQISTSEKSEQLMTETNPLSLNQ